MTAPSASSNGLSPPSPSSPPLPAPTFPASQQDAQVDSPAQSESEHERQVGATPGKKKKKKKRRTAAEKTAARKAAEAAQEDGKGSEEPYKGVWAMLARNKHLKYISLFNGPWLSLPPHDLSTYQVVNSNERSRASLRGLLDEPLNAQLTSLSSLLNDPSATLPSSLSSLTLAQRKALAASASAARFPQEYLDAVNATDSIPPPIDPAAFMAAVEVRKLVDEATDFALRASSGLSAAELEALNKNPFGRDPVPDPYGSGGRTNGGRPPPPMSGVRQHRFRALAVSKLAAAYRLDEVATAVLVMQQGENLEELAEKVKKQERDNADASYVSYFSEKIPSRALSPATDVDVLNWLISRDPSNLAYYRTKGVHLSTFQQDYPAAISTITAGLEQAASASAAASQSLFSKSSSSRKKRSAKSSESPSRYSGSPHDSRTSSPSRPSPSSFANPSSSSSHSPRPLKLGKTPGDDLPRQLTFHRGMAHFHLARSLIEEAVLRVEGVQLPPNRRNDEGGAWTLRNLGIDLPKGHKGLYLTSSEEKQLLYREKLGDPAFLENVNGSLRSALKDLEAFLGHFEMYEAPIGSPLEQLPRLASGQGVNDPPRPSSLEEPLTFLGRRLVHLRALSPRTFTRDPRRTFSTPSSSSSPSSPQPDPPQSRALLTTFHPFLLEAHSTGLLALLLLGSFTEAAKAHTTLVRLAEQLEGYPLFSPPRVGSQAEYAELVERVWGSWGKYRALAFPKEEEGKEPVPENEAHLGAAGPANAALRSLTAVADLFSPSFLVAYIKKAERWWEEKGRKEEEARERAERERAERAVGGGGGGGGKKALAVTQGEKGEEGGPRMGSWREEREKAEEKMRKIDPSYAPLTTAHTELALAFLHAAVLPPLEAGEKAELEAQKNVDVKGKGKGKAQEEEEGDRGKGKGKGKGRAEANGCEERESGWAGGSGGSSSSSTAFHPFPPSGSSSSSPSFSRTNGDAAFASFEAGAGGSGSGSKGKGKARA
ncbi:hypothetical protein JCM8547_003040 [Rhodosporidiobolus lusitaniae]